MNTTEYHSNDTPNEQAIAVQQYRLTATNLKPSKRSKEKKRKWMSLYKIKKQN